MSFFIGLFFYVIVAGVIYKVLVKLDIGVTHYSYLKDETFGAMCLSICWILTIWFIVGAKITEKYLIPLFENIKGDKE